MYPAKIQIHHALKSNANITQTIFYPRKRHWESAFFSFSCQKIERSTHHYILATLIGQIIWRVWYFIHAWTGSKNTAYYGIFNFELHPERNKLTASAWSLRFLDCDTQTFYKGSADAGVKHHSSGFGQGKLPFKPGCTLRRILYLILTNMT